MEADWEFDLGRESPAIEALWPGLVDLRSDPQSVDQIVECRRLKGLAKALLRLNAQSAPVWTSKCDVWRIDAFDPDELDAPRERATTVIACYIDLLPKSDQLWSTPARLEAICRAFCTQLHAIPVRCCRVDFVIRRAQVVTDGTACGITTYLVACGASENEAEGQLAMALAAVVDSVIRAQSHDGTCQSYNENTGE